MKSFGSKELIKCLVKLKFTPEPQVGSRHRKYTSPNKVEKGSRPFFIVIQGRKEYDRVTQKKIINQVKKLGFSEDQIMEAMWK